MGKVVKQKQHRGVHRAAGAFHAEERNEANVSRPEAEEVSRKSTAMVECAATQSSDR